MNVELFSYSIMASILGIVIVFLSLVGLCLLMVLLKVIFQDREKPAEAATVAPTAPAVSAVPQENTDWVMAAVVAFLMEEDGPAPSTAGWTPRATEVSDPWMNRAAFGNKLG